LTVGTVAGFFLVAAGLLAVGARKPDPPTAIDVTNDFRRPTGIPVPADNPQSEYKIELGARLFFDVRLSSSGTLSCATCHDPKLGFADGARKSTAGATRRELKRHTPTLWNLAWAPALFWDGRSRSLEEQVWGPITHPDEMASTPEDAARRLATDRDYAKLVRSAFPGESQLTAPLIARALAAYERTLVSPPTRFDAWIAGDPIALNAEQQEGFALFIGKAGCVACHSGFAFTDHSFHDIGLPGEDAGRGEVAGLDRIRHAFKTPTLRELTWTAPYMHDGSMDTLEDVVRHYESGGIARGSRSPDMPKALQLSDAERSALIAFLESLSSDRPPTPSSEVWIGRPFQDAAPVPARTLLVSQRGKTFSPGAVKVASGQALTILNDDTRTHNVRIVDRRWNYTSGAQDPGESIVIKLDHLGRFEAHCAIHPTMRLIVEVE
jgi:cytochrome c peroxidase